MRRERRDVWIASDGTEWLDRELAIQHERKIQLNELLEPYCADALEHGRIVAALLVMLADGRLILPPRGEPETPRLL